MKNKGNIGTTLVVIIISAFIFVFGGPGTTKREPNTYYAVYVDGKKIGMVDSETKFEDYINTQEEKLKEKYGVDTIYTPKGVEVKKLITYDNNVDSYDDIYRKLVNNKSFTIKGVVITISDKEKCKYTMINALENLGFGNFSRVNRYFNEIAFNKVFNNASVSIKIIDYLKCCLLDESDINYNLISFYVNYYDTIIYNRRITIKNDLQRMKDELVELVLERKRLDKSIEKLATEIEKKELILKR